jgi:hypothetical protein
MAQTVADFIWTRLQAWGVRRVFSYPGDGIGGLIGALARSRAPSTLYRCATRRWPGSWPRAMPSSPARWACASPPRGRAPSTCSHSGCWSPLCDHEPTP